MVVNSLETIVDAADIVAFEQLPQQRQQKIKKALSPRASLPECMVFPQTPEALAEVVALAYKNGWGILPTGNSSKIDWGGLASGVKLIVSTERLCGVVEHAAGDLTLTAAAGTPFAQVQATMAAENQFLALDPTYRDRATLGGMVATADSGFLRQRYGGVRDQLIGISFVRSDGVFAKAGGRVVKNVAGYDMMKLFTGSYGTLGILTQVTFRAYPMPPAATTVVISGDVSQIAEAGKMLLASTLTPTALEYVSASVMAQLDMGNEMGLWVRFQSTPESVEEQAKNTVKILENVSINAQIYGDANESDLWKRLSTFMESPSPGWEILGKIGVKPTSAVACLDQIPEGAIACMRGRSGLGRIRFPYQEGQPTSDEIKRLRTFCETERGFLTILEAPPALKNQIDVWGYSGNAFSWMEKIKNQFDDRKILNPYRFVGGI